MNTIKCDICNYIGRPDNVRAPTQSVHLKIRLKCDVCNKDFVTKTSLKRHKCPTLNEPPNAISEGGQNPQSGIGLENIPVASEKMNSMSAMSER